MNAFVKEVSINVYIQERIQGVQEEVCPPPLNLSKGVTAPPLRIVPCLRDSGGGNKNTGKSLKQFRGDNYMRHDILSRSTEHHP